MTEPPLVDCPECDGQVCRIIQPVGILFKGSGFYVTDNRSHSPTALPGKKETASEPKEADTASTKSDSADTSSPDSD
jgi:predicted nucleic acid-binding Zn ribbon protein